MGFIKGLFDSSQSKKNLKKMVDSTKLRNLKKLNLLGTAITDKHIKQLASSNYFNLLQELILR